MRLLLCIPSAALVLLQMFLLLGVLSNKASTEWIVRMWQRSTECDISSMANNNLMDCEWELKLWSVCGVDNGTFNPLIPR